MPKYIVNRDSGWPTPAEHFLAPTYRQGESFESNDPQCEKAVQQGYLSRADESQRVADWPGVQELAESDSES
jgi:hypothetical protein